MAQTHITFVLAGAFTALCSAEEKPPTIPASSDAVRYERGASQAGKGDAHTEIANNLGEDILTALDGGHALKCWTWPEGVICALPVPTLNTITVVTRQNARYTMSFSDSGVLVLLPEGYYVVNETARVKIQKILYTISHKDKPKLDVKKLTFPYAYIVGSSDDGGTLSGIARLFYGDANKWKKIHEANRDTIKNPDKIVDGMKLTIPKDD